MNSLYPFIFLVKFFLSAYLLSICSKYPVVSTLELEGRRCDKKVLFFQFYKIFLCIFLVKKLKRGILKCHQKPGVQFLLVQFWWRLKECKLRNCSRFRMREIKCHPPGWMAGWPCPCVWKALSMDLHLKLKHVCVHRSLFTFGQIIFMLLTSYYIEWFYGQIYFKCKMLIRDRLSG